MKTEYHHIYPLYRIYAIITRPSGYAYAGYGQQIIRCVVALCLGSILVVFGLRTGHYIKISKYTIERRRFCP